MEYLVLRGGRKVEAKLLREKNLRSSSFRRKKGGEVRKPSSFSAASAPQGNLRTPICVLTRLKPFVSRTGGEGGKKTKKSLLFSGKQTGLKERESSSTFESETKPYQHWLSRRKKKRKEREMFLHTTSRAREKEANSHILVGVEGEVAVSLFKA